MNAAYFSAAIPEPFQIIGLRLKPLSLGRYRLLKRFDVAFVSDSEQKATPADLILGVLICAHRCDEFLQWISAPGFRKEVGKWGARVCSQNFDGLIPLKRGWRFWRKPKGFNIIEKLQLFNRYISSHSYAPKYWDTDSGSSGASGAHWAQSIEVTLRAELGWSEEEINEQPLSKALADYFKYAESQGMLRLMTDEDVAQGEANARIFAALDAEGNANN